MLRCSRRYRATPRLWGLLSVMPRCRPAYFSVRAVLQFPVAFPEFRFTLKRATKRRVRQRTHKAALDASLTNDAFRRRSIGVARAWRLPFMSVALRGSQRLLDHRGITTRSRRRLRVSRSYPYSPSGANAPQLG